MKKRRSFLIAFLALVFALTSFSPAFAQSEDGYRLVLKREWGVGIPGAVQGHMSLDIKGELKDVLTVTYFIDGNEMSKRTALDFKFRFNTDDYPSNLHTFHAIIERQDGSHVKSNIVNIKFLAKAEAGKINRNIFLGIGVLTVLILLLTFLINKRKSKQNHQSDQAVTGYGLYGAAVCPKCGQLFKRTIVGLNLVTDRYEPCPHCGKWSMTQRATKEEIEAAQKSDLNQDESVTPAPESLYNEKEQIDESKYTEL